MDAALTIVPITAMLVAMLYHVDVRVRELEKRDRMRERAAARLWCLCQS